MKVNWQGVFPAVTTQFNDDFSINYDQTGRVIDALLADGVSGLVMCGTVGEGNALSADEKRSILSLAVERTAGRVPVLTGVAEYTTQLAADLAHDAQKIGIDGLMVLPAMVYNAKVSETVAHFEGVAKASDLPIMIYNNPPAYRIDLTPEVIADLAKIDTMAAIKESSGMTNRLVDIRNLIGDRLALFCGLDDVLLESMVLGAVGWVSGMSNVFPREGEALFRLAKVGRWDEARALYDWFMPLMHLDARPDLVQCIKLCEQIAGRGCERTRPPRLALRGEDRKHVEHIMDVALKNRIALPKDL